MYQGFGTIPRLPFPSASTSPYLHDAHSRVPKAMLLKILRAHPLHQQFSNENKMSPKYFNHAAPDCEKRTTMTTPNIRDPLSSLPLEIRWKIYRLILYSPHLIKFKLGLEYKDGRTSSELGLSDCDTIIHPLASTCGPIRDEIKSWIRKEMVLQGEPHTLHNSIAMDLFNQRGKNLKIYGMLRERGGFCITLWDRVMPLICVMNTE
ncbi:uncharacterized protein RAG0_12052 [Rhynchosporium agropyri]|uniref:Uncharacterized protein n=1 Tax=Rhynchosporium agropyri TaxID=914238 RepID=A0A1E1L709_9HELO|nr:uncharacterized protein RAG0_12052 [Rhynchosporium agropyri]